MKKVILRIMLLALILCFVCAIFSLGVNYHVKSSVKENILTAQQAAQLNDIDCILVLGSRVWKDGTPSKMLEERLSLSVELHSAGVSKKILMSGDHGKKDYDEVNVMKNYTIEKGIKSEDIFMDHAGFSTYESMYRARDVFKAKRVVIVTQEYHMYRALYDAKALGLEAYGVTSDSVRYSGQTFRDVREVAARVKDFAFCLAKPEPTCLGEAIPISGNGDLTAG